MTCVTPVRALPVTRATADELLDVVSIVAMLAYIRRLLTNCGVSSCGDTGFFGHTNVYHPMLVLLSRTHDSRLNPST